MPWVSYPFARSYADLKSGNALVFRAPFAIGRLKGAIERLSSGNPKYWLTTISLSLGNWL